MLTKKNYINNLKELMAGVALLHLEKGTDNINEFLDFLKEKQKENPHPNFDENKIKEVVRNFKDITGSNSCLDLISFTHLHLCMQEVREKGTFKRFFSKNKED